MWFVVFCVGCDLRKGKKEKEKETERVFGVCFFVGGLVGSEFSWTCCVTVNN